MTLETVAPPGGGVLLLNILHIIDQLDDNMSKTDVWHYFLEVSYGSANGVMIYFIRHHSSVVKYV